MKPVDAHFAELAKSHPPAQELVDAQTFEQSEFASRSFASAMKFLPTPRES